jgi:hypothetical protein
MALFFKGELTNPDRAPQPALLIGSFLLDHYAPNRPRTQQLDLLKCFKPANPKLACPASPPTIPIKIAVKAFAMVFLTSAFC